MNRRTNNKTVSSPKKYDRFNASEVVKYYEKNGLLKKNRPPSIPKAANWGWSYLPLPAKIMIFGVFCGAVSVTTPYWAFIKSHSMKYSTFGLWHFCSGDHCSSIHDNLVEGKSVETWYHLTQGCMCIGVAMSIVALGMLTNSIEGRRFRMSITVHWTCICVLAISALEHLLALYIFITYLPDTSFLYDEELTQHIDLYGSCYLGIVSFICSLLTAFLIFINEAIYRNNKKGYRSSRSCRGDDNYSGSSGYGSIGGSGCGSNNAGAYGNNDGSAYGSVGGPEGMVNYGVDDRDGYNGMMEQQGYYKNEEEDYYNEGFEDDGYYYNQGYKDYVEDVATTQPGYHENRDGKRNLKI